MKLYPAAFVGLLMIVSLQTYCRDYRQLRAGGGVIRVLIVDGFSNHDWKQTTLMVRSILEETGRFEVTVSTAPNTVDSLSRTSWDPAFERYDVVIQNTNNIQDTALRWPRRVEQRLEAYVRGGGGLYVLHSANNAFASWPEYDSIIGLGWRPKDFGYALQLDAADHITRIPPGQGEGTNHGARFDAVIHIVTRHPINQGYPQRWRTASMELYRYARGPAENITVLSAATDSVTGKIFPVDWVVRYGKGRVYASSMGHLWKGDVYPVSYRSIDFQTTLIRATEWLARGEVSYPVPGNFPTAEGTSLRVEAPWNAMRNTSRQLRLILVPFVIIAICVVGAYTFLNWVLFIKTRAFSLNEEVINIWIPLALPWIPILIWLWPRIKLLNLKRKKTDLPGLYLVIAGFAIVVPTCIAQSYLQTASGELTRLTTIEQIGKYEETKYYTLGKFYIDKAHVGVQTSFEVTGKHSENLNMNLYVVLPILSSEEDTLQYRCLAWYGIKYHEQISNRLDKDEKEARYQTFANTSQADFDRKDVNQFVYLDRIGNTDDHKEYISAVKNNKTFSTDGTAILIPVNEPFEARNGNKLAWIFGALAIGMTIWSIMVAIPKFDDSALEKFENGIEERSDSARELWSFFLPREGFFITPIIIDINILVFIIMVFAGLGFVSFKGDDLLAWGANFRPATGNGQWWRLVTSVFLHGGIMHLLANMYGLLFVGIFLEPRLGKIRFAMVYLITGILASIASLWWHAATVSVGASGAIFGLYGAFLALLLMKVFPKDFSKVFLGSTLIFVGFNLVMGFTGSIDNAAHLGGLVSGFVIGLILSPGSKFRTESPKFPL